MDCADVTLVDDDECDVLQIWDKLAMGMRMRMWRNIDSINIRLKSDDENK